MKHKETIKQLAQWKEASIEELRSKLADLDKDLQSFRLQKATGQLGQQHLLAATRRDIARIKTVMQAKVNQVAPVAAMSEK